MFILYYYIYIYIYCVIYNSNPCGFFYVYQPATVNTASRDVNHNSINNSSPTDL